MELDDATRDELAGFYARRFPTDSARAAIARAAGLAPDEGMADARAAWVALLARADRGGVLARLADAACAAAPDDPNLAEARALLRGDRTTSAHWKRVAAVAAAVVVVGLVGVGGVGDWWLGRDAGGGSSGVEERAEVASVAPAAEAGSVAREPGVPPVAPETMAPEAAEPVAAEPVPAPASVPQSAPVTQPPPEPSAAVEPAETASPARGLPARCQGAPGVVVGWWYAGTTAPGALGATISLPTSVNVRDDYPRKENRYALAGRVLCSLPAGTSQRLSQAPVDIGQGHWWVPLSGGDIDR